MTTVHYLPRSTVLSPLFFHPRSTIYLPSSVLGLPVPLSLPNTTGLAVLQFTPPLANLLRRNEKQQQSLQSFYSGTSTSYLCLSPDMQIVEPW